MMDGQSRFLTNEQANHVFKQIVADYGLSAVKSKWESMKPSELVSNVARRLGCYEWETVMWALDRMIPAHPKFPPNIPELVALCEQKPKAQQFYVPLPAPEITREEAERRAKQMEKAASDIAAKRANKDWAKKIVANPKDYPSFSLTMARAALGDE